MLDSSDLTSGDELVCWIHQTVHQGVS